MKLYKLLFENVNEEDVLDEIYDMLRSSSGTAKYIKTFINFPSLSVSANISSKGMALAKHFYQETKNEWNKILNNATSIKHLGGGSKGNAFNVKTKDGNYILKLELETPWDTRFSSKKRATIASTALFGEPKPQQPQPTLPPPNDLRTIRESIGINVPMIYGQGTMKYPNQQGGQEISWTLMEKFEIPNKKNENLLNDLLDDLTNRFSTGEDLQQVKQEQNLSSDLQNNVKEISQSLRLKDNWFEELVTAMWNLYQKDISDFHAGNIGVRRSGAQGTLVFFD